MSEEKQRTYLLGCAFVGLFCLIILCTAASNRLWHVRNGAHYPDAVSLSNHSNYSATSHRIRWDNTYRSQDPFPVILTWYIARFTLDPQGHANGSCSTYTGFAYQGRVEHFTSLTLCETQKGQIIFVSRILWFR